MKRVINGKRYDTETARYVEEASGDGYPGDFYHWKETLYVTRKDNYFLAGQGGPLSRWGRQGVQMNEHVGGEGIRPLDKTDAWKWLERHSDAATIEKEFGDNIEDA